jgi:LysM repeat protein
MGNILTQKRNGGGTSATALDELTYNYHTTTDGLVSNRLYQVNDVVSAGNYTDDIDDQGTFNNTHSTIETANNYGYDELGNLVRDAQEEIASIEWTVYGKMKKITRNSGSSKADLEFGYDASGNRLWKKVTPKGSGAVISTYYYLRDAQGNEMCRYVKYTNTTSQLMYVAQEHSIYGSSRVGVDNRKDTLYIAGSYSPSWGGVGTSRRALGLKSFEIANHLGNVLVTVSDKPVYKVSSGTIYFQPEITSTSDYYPFGAPINERSFSSTEYRFGFNTQEKTDEIAGPGNHNTATFWEYDTRLGRRWNVDPVTKPWESLYACLSDNPISLVDPEGNDPRNPKRYIVVGGDDLTKIGNKYGVSVDNLVKWNNIPKRNEIEIGQSLIVSDPTKVKEPEGFVWINSANSTFGQPKTVKDPEEYLWWASGNSPRTNSPISNQPFKPLSTIGSNNTENAQGIEGQGNEWVETGFVINNVVDNSLSITTGSIVGAQKLANSVANTTYEVVTEIPVLHTLGRLTGAVSIADNFMKFRQNPSENWWNGVECVGQIGFYFCGGGEAEIIFNLGTMGIDAGIELWNYSTQPQLNSNKK